MSDNTGRQTNTSHEGELRQGIVDAGRQFWQMGFIPGGSGNFSVRLDSERILVTPRGARKGFLRSDSLVITDNSGKLVSGDAEPSSEFRMHLHVYANRSEIGACLHSHAPSATALALAGIQPPLDVHPEIVANVGQIALTEYAPPGTDAVGDSLEPHLSSGCKAFLLRKHGLLTIGATLDSAVRLHETVEWYCRVILAIRQLGRIEPLPPEEIQRLKNLSKK